jgi:hypothetical protein
MVVQQDQNKGAALDSVGGGGVAAAAAEECGNGQGGTANHTQGTGSGHGSAGDGGCMAGAPTPEGSDGPTQLSVEPGLQPQASLSVSAGEADSAMAARKEQLRAPQQQQQQQQHGTTPGAGLGEGATGGSLSHSSAQGPRVVLCDLCCGLGGLSLGLLRALPGSRVWQAVDLFESALDTYQDCHPGEQQVRAAPG